MNVLLIAPRFYDYDTKIKEEIERQGHTVDIFCEYKERYSVFTKIIARFINKKLRIKNNRNKQKIILEKSIHKRYNIILVIVGRFLTRDFVQNLRTQQSEAKFILYLWDDVKRCESFDDIHTYFDTIYSFDRKNCIDYGYKFLPLFYTRDFKPVICRKTISIYGAFSAHSDRIQIIKKIARQTSDAYFYIFYLSKMDWLKYLILGKKENLNNQIHMSIVSLSESQNIQNMQKAKCILDIQHPAQTGLTIRSIESIGCEKKLITTNTDIVNYDFYNPQNIAIIDRDNPLISKDFFDTDYVRLDEKIYRQYSIEQFVKKLLEE